MELGALFCSTDLAREVPTFIFQCYIRRSKKNMEHRSKRGQLRQRRRPVALLPIRHRLGQKIRAVFCTQRRRLSRARLWRRHGCGSHGARSAMTLDIRWLEAAESLVRTHACDATNRLLDARPRRESANRAVAPADETAGEDRLASVHGP